MKLIKVESTFDITSRLYDQDVKDLIGDNEAIIYEDYEMNPNAQYVDLRDNNPYYENVSTALFKIIINTLAVAGAGLI